MEVENSFINVNLIEIRSILYDSGRSITNTVEHGATVCTTYRNTGTHEKSFKLYDAVLVQEFLKKK